MNDSKTLKIENIKQIRVISDPYRWEILSHIKLIGRPATSKEIAVSMKEAPSKINYHLKVLEKYNFVTIDHTENINGIIAKYYTLSAKRYDFTGEDKTRTKEKEAALLNMVEGMYNNSKQKYFNKAMMAQNDKCDEDMAQLLSAKFYLSKEDVEEINSMFEKLSNNKKEDKDVYSVFMSIIKE